MKLVECGTFVEGRSLYQAATSTTNTKTRNVTMWASSIIAPGTSETWRKGIAMANSGAKDDDEISIFSDLDEVLSPIPTRSTRSLFRPFQSPTGLAVTPFVSPPTLLRSATTAQRACTAPVWQQSPSVFCQGLRLPLNGPVIPPAPNQPSDLMAYMQRSSQTGAFLEHQLASHELTSARAHQSPPREILVVQPQAKSSNARHHRRLKVSKMRRRRSSTIKKVGFAEKPTIVPTSPAPGKLLTEQDYLRLHREHIEKELRLASVVEASKSSTEQYEEPWLTTPSATPFMTEEQYLQLHMLTMQMQRSHATRQNVVTLPADAAGQVAIAAATATSPCVTDKVGKPVKESSDRDGKPSILNLQSRPTNLAPLPVVGDAQHLSTPVSTAASSACMVTQSPAAFSKMNGSSDSQCELKNQRMSMLLLKQQLLSGHGNGSGNGSIQSSPLFAPDLTVRATYAAQTKEYPSPGGPYVNHSNFNSVSSFLKQQYPNVHKSVSQSTSKQLCD